MKIQKLKNKKSMKNKIFFFFFIVILITISCAREIAQPEVPEFDKFYVGIESSETRTFADEQGRVLWHNGDFVSVFPKKQYQVQYQYTGGNGTTGGEIVLYSEPASTVGGDASKFFAVYPYEPENGLDNDENFILNIHHEQTAGYQTFGRGDNLMVAASEDNHFQFKNVCGYLVLRLYGDAEVASIKIKGNNDEPLAGNVRVNMGETGDPEATMLYGRQYQNKYTTYKEIVLDCVDPDFGAIQLNPDKTDYEEFWIALPPMTFTKGFTLEITDTKGTTLTKTTSTEIVVNRSKKKPYKTQVSYPVAVTGVALDNSEITIEVGKTKQLVATLEPSNATMNGLQWKSSDTSIASVDEKGEVTAIAEGEAGITVTTSDGGFTASCKVSVIPQDETEIIVFADENLKERLVAKFDLNGDGELSHKEAAAVMSGDDLKNALGAIKTYKSFREFQYFTNVKSIPESFFSSWNQLSAIEIPSSVESIGNYAFKNCICLSSIVLPDNLRDLGYGVFAGCSSLKSMRIPDSVSGTFGRFISLEHSNPSGFYGDGMFEDCISLEEVVLSKNITALGVFTFKNCPELSNLVIPSSIEIFSIGTFVGCEKLVSVAVPESMTIIPSRLFSGCSSLSTVTIPEHVTKIGSSAFSGCQSLTSFRIPESVSSIGEGAFSGCTSMTSISIPESISQIDSETFQDCGLTSVFIPESVTSIGQAAFRRCRALESITIPNSVTSISQYAFEYCSSLISVSIPEGIRELGSQVFRGCTSLSSVSLPDTDLLLSSTFKDCSGLEEIVIPSKVRLFYSFENCIGLKSITFIEGRERIGVAAFLGCSALKSVTIPKDVVNIDTYAFSGCTGLTSVTCEAITPPTGASLMFPSTGDYVIYVPTESVDAYKSADKWNVYASRIQAIPSSTPIPGAVDLGLSVKWASFNLGASKPEDNGDYYVWGENEPYYISIEPLTWKEGKKSGYSWDSYKWCNGSYNTLTKYCNNSSFGNNGYVDSKTVLDLEDDASHVNLGGNWRMPTDNEWKELKDNCTWTWSTQNSVNGILVTASNGNSIFLPVAGFMSNTGVNYVGQYGYYWSSNLYSDNPRKARSVFFDSSLFNQDANDRYGAFSVRPVTE